MVVHRTQWLTCTQRHSNLQFTIYTLQISQQSTQSETADHMENLISPSTWIILPEHMEQSTWSTWSSCFLGAHIWSLGVHGAEPVNSCSLEHLEQLHPVPEHTEQSTWAVPISEQKEQSNVASAFLEYILQGLLCSSTVALCAPIMQLLHGPTGSLPSAPGKQPVYVLRFMWHVLWVCSCSVCSSWAPP